MVAAGGDCDHVRQARRDRYLSLGIEAPTRDSAVLPECKRMIQTRGDRDHAGETGGDWGER